MLYTVLHGTILYSTLLYYTMPYLLGTLTILITQSRLLPTALLPTANAVCLYERVAFPPSFPSLLTHDWLASQKWDETGLFFYIYILFHAGTCSVSGSVTVTAGAALLALVGSWVIHTQFSSSVVEDFLVGLHCDSAYPTSSTKTTTNPPYTAHNTTNTHTHCTYLYNNTTT